MNTNASLPKWVVQLLAWGTGVGGLIADYGLGLFGKNNQPFVYYALCIGIGFGINPGFVVELLLKGYAAKTKPTDEEATKPPAKRTPKKVAPDGE